MLTVQIKVSVQDTITNYQLAKIDGELIWDRLHSMKPVIVSEDRDYWLSAEDLQAFILDPIEYAPIEAKDRIHAAGARWVICVEHYSRAASEHIDPNKLESMRKSARKKQLLSAMSPEDRALFEEG